MLGGDPKGKNFLYTNGNSVIIRNIEVCNNSYEDEIDNDNDKQVPLLLSAFFDQNPAISDIYTEHSCAVNVAKYSPSGFYIASGGELT